jgi:hypothetical protein
MINYLLKLFGFSTEMTHNDTKVLVHSCKCDEIIKNKIKEYDKDLEAKLTIIEKQHTKNTIH